jgi:hypothetical protein
MYSMVKAMVKVHSRAIRNEPNRSITDSTLAIMTEATLSKMHTISVTSKAFPRGVSASKIMSRHHSLKVDFGLTNIGSSSLTASMLSNGGVFLSLL